MSAPVLTTWSVASPAAAAGLKKKRVLLIDTSRAKRDLRSETMRKLGVEVDCAADISEARCWWRADLYDLVLIHVDEATAPRDKFCDDMRSATPPQQVMFFVGKPEYLAIAPSLDSDLSQFSPIPVDDSEPGVWNDVKTALTATLTNAPSQRWGILEACRRISAVRSVSEARSKAIRNRPAPPRDSEIMQTKRTDEVDIMAQIVRERTQ
jgi:DNA-binding NtrC family response regulator